MLLIVLLLIPVALALGMVVWIALSGHLQLVGPLALMFLAVVPAAYSVWHRVRRGSRSRVGMGLTYGMLLLGLLVPAAGSFVPNAWTRLVVGDASGLTWKEFGALLAPLFLSVYAMVFGYRLICHSRRPGAVSLGVFVALMWAMALLNRG